MDSYFPLLRTSGMDRKEQHWGQAHLGCGPWGKPLILANFSESVCSSVRWGLRKLPLGTTKASSQGCCEICARLVTGSYYQVGLPSNSNGKESARSVASYYQDSLCKLYSPKELDVVLGPFRVIFSISTQKTRGKLKKKIPLQPLQTV